MVESKKKILQTFASSLTSCVNSNISNMLSQGVLRNSLSCVSPSLAQTSYEVKSLTSSVSQAASSLSTMGLPEEITGRAFAISQLTSSILKIESDASHVLSPFFFSFINQSFAPLLQEQTVENLTPLLSQYLAILQQDDVQDLLMRIQQKIHLLDSEAEELKGQFFKKIFFKMTEKELPLSNIILSSLKKSYEIYPSLFANFQHAPTSIRMLWNNYSYDKKVKQALMLELLLQGFAIHALANLHVTLDITDSTPPELPPVSYLKVALLGKKLIL